MLVEFIVLERGVHWTANSTTRHSALHVRYSLMALVTVVLLIATFHPVLARL